MPSALVRSSRSDQRPKPGDDEDARDDDQAGDVGGRAVRVREAAQLCLGKPHDYSDTDANERAPSGVPPDPKARSHEDQQQAQPEQRHDQQHQRDDETAEEAGDECDGTPTHEAALV